MTEEVSCQYLVNEDEEHPRFESENIEDGVVTCNAEARVVIRPEGLAAISRGRQTKRAVCRNHARFLTSEKSERDWEQCGEEKAVETLVESEKGGRP